MQSFENHFKIIYEDQHIIVIDKMSGLLSQGESSGSVNLVDLLRTYFQRHYVGLIHRLDRNTSGLMVVAKRTKSAQRLTDALQKNQIQRDYLAWLEGDFYQTLKIQPITTEIYHWEDWLVRDEVTLKSSLASQNSPSSSQDLAQKAILNIKCLKVIDIKQKRLSLAHFELETGRSHQIRVQCASRGLPLLGDFKYGAKLKFPRLALHSYQIKFPHPMTHEIMSFKTELPTVLQLDKSSIS
jgi:23S rRNA pseudouridine1911/1915/1917 synthase